jgi:regulator of protease activity HflC (stomatin/prohibitin superfamily)
MSGRSRAGCFTLFLGLLALFGVIFVYNGIHAIPLNSVGVVFNSQTGKVTHVMNSKVVWVWPWFERLLTYPTGIRNASYVMAAHEGERQGDDSIKASTAEGAILPVDITVAYHVKPSQVDVQKVLDSFGVVDLETIQADYIRWQVFAAVNDVCGQRPIFDLISKDRATIGPDIQAALAPRLATWGITVDNVLFREVHPRQEIQDKINEQQQVRNDLAQANTQLQRAQIEAQTLLTQAQANAAKNRFLAAQNNQALTLKQIEVRNKFIERWNGHLSLVGDANIPH